MHISEVNLTKNCIELSCVTYDVPDNIQTRAVAIRELLDYRIDNLNEYHNVSHIISVMWEQSID